jgi:iron complex transport system permease protein
MEACAPHGEMTVEAPAQQRFRAAGAWLAPALLVAIGCLAVASLAIGPAPIPPGTAAKALLTDQGSASLIVREIRLPRMMLAIIIGGTLGITGAALQGLLRNPLADASVFGAPQAAALGAVLVLYFGLAGALSWALPLAAILGALFSIALVVAIAGREGGTVVLVLAGLAIGSLAGAATSLAISLSPNPFAITEIVFWLLGSLEDRSMTHVLLAAPFLLIAFALLLSTGPALRALTLGEEAAASLGVNVARTRIIIVAASAIGAGASVAVAGAIGFIGLVAPHLVRPFVGYDPARTLVPSALTGAALLLAADCAVRVIPSGVEVRIGVLTALLGVPVFLWIIARRRNELVGAVA